MLVEVGVVHHIVAALALDRLERVEVKADHQKEAGLHLPIHQFVDQATEVLLGIGPGLSLAPEEDLGHVQDHEMCEGS